jgi:hypothetical protein
MASVLKVDKLDPQSGTALEIGSSGDTITIPSGATFTQSGTMNASAITAGTVATARLGTGTASSSTVLYGDNTWAAAGGGKILQVVNTIYSTVTSTTSSGSSTTAYADTGLTASLTTTAANSKVLCLYTQSCAKINTTDNYNNGIGVKLLQDIDSGGYSAVTTRTTYWGYGVHQTTRWRMGSASGSSLSAAQTSSGTVVSYKTQYNLYNSEDATSATAYAQSDGDDSSMTLFEVGA